MSDDSGPQVTSEELNSWLQRDRDKQQMVAERLIVSPRTIDGWRHGGSIPSRYQVILRQMMSGEDSMVLSLPPETLARIARQAKAKGYKSKEAFIAELLKGFMAFLVAASLGYHLVRSEKPEPAAVSSVAVDVPVARKAKPEPDED